MPTAVLNRRLSGIVLHPSSLPGPQWHGSFGAEAYRWVDWLQQSGFRIWQMLPLCPVADGSPYNSYSAFSGNPRFIDIARLTQLGLPEYRQPITTEQDLNAALDSAFQWLQEHPESGVNLEFSTFKNTSSWLDDAALFAVIKQRYPVHWLEWPEPLRQRASGTLEQLKIELAQAIEQQRFIQFLFHRQWHDLKHYANERGILIFGDLPIFVAHDSADVWANRELYKLNADGSPYVVAGVPPDYFSATGQRWGNPIYQWQTHEQTGFSWWKQRLNHNLELYDAVRIDHFRGFLACWEIPASEPTAINGQWIPSPGNQLLNALVDERKELPLIAEDLGIITDDVIALRKKHHLPGMKILQFAFDSDGNNPYLPHNHTRDTVIYTGTHDNNTTVGWYKHLSPAIKQRIHNYYAEPAEAMPWPLIKSALASPARWAMLPFQDLLELDEQHRMNTPGTTEGNWNWRFEWHQIRPELASKMKALNELYNR